MWSSKPYYISPLRVLRSRQNARQVMVNSQSAEIAISKMTGMEAYDRISKLTHSIQSFDSNLQAIYSLLNGKSDYLIADEASASFIIDQLQLGQIYQVETTLNFGSLSFIFSSQNAQLLDVLNQTISATPVEVMNQLQGRWNKPIPSYLDTGNAALTPMEAQWVKQNPLVHYAATENDYPFVYRGSDGQPHGFVVDILNIIAQNSGLRFSPVWSANEQQADQEVDQHKAAFRAVLPLFEQAKRQYESSMAYHRSLWGVYVPQSAGNVSTWQGLSGKRIGALRGDLSLSIIPASLNVQIFNDSPSLYNALANGQIDALVDNIVTANFTALSRYAGVIKLAFAANNISYPIAFGVPKNAPLLLGILDKNLQQIPSQTLQTLRDQWVSDRRNVIDAVNDNRMQPQTTWLLSLLAAVVVVLLIILSRRLYLQRRDKQERQRLDLARRQAEEANRSKSHFLATISHELRTPMHAILGLLELELKDGRPNGDNLPLVYSSASSLMNLLNDLQDYARLDSGVLTLSPQPLALRSWLLQLPKLFIPLIGQRPIVFTLHTVEPLPEVVLIDGNRLMQIINNLVSNAIKFTESGRIDLTLSWLTVEATAGELQIVISDTGSGIAADEQEKLFQPFYRAAGAQRVSVQGSGLGLSVCKEIVEKMSGTIRLTSILGEGTSVNISLPSSTLPLSALKEPEVSFSAEQASHDLVYPLRVAVIDDHPTNLLLMQRQLLSCGIVASTFESGKIFLLACATQTFDLLFIDYNMPRPDGALLGRLIRRQERQHGRSPCHIVLCSADVQEFTRLPIQRLGVNDFLTKPVSLAAIQAILTSVLNARQAELAAFEDKLHERGNGNPSLVKRLIDTLCQTLGEDRQKLVEAAAAQDWPSMAKAAHRIKGSLLIIGDEHQAALCQRLIEACQHGKKHQQAYNKVINLLQTLLHQLEILRKSAQT
ncbi:transporter substrate-binding domain-containing protein [Serratia sp. M24T3]|uniref:ATP-binding protein n=1 Tax=Serratia sp. M24T3 TaxID=932213 RepID=UPI0021013712|nr:transporter substrate-binding domain-containing protein [Serratia sp. M24T3]